MVEFLKGLGACLGGFALWFVGSLLAVADVYDPDKDYSMWDANPIWLLMVVGGFAIMIIGPIWYWLVKGLVAKYREKSEVDM